MRVRLDPPIEQWQPRSGVIATGHQAWLWHPGILAKDVAARAIADATGGSVRHLVVDHDAHEALTLALPEIDGEVLRVRSLRLAATRQDVPTGWQPPVDAAAVARQLTSQGRDDLQALIEAWTDLPPAASLGRQIGLALQRLMRPWVGEVDLWHTSDMIRRPAFTEALDALRDDPLRCAMIYNRAVADHRQAGIAPLMVGREFIETPLWALQWNQPRQRVFVDVADRTHRFVLPDGSPIDSGVFDLAPRALLLTAMMRSRSCGLFIHGTGGYVYDRITEQWWRQWRGEELAPMTLATADLYLDLPAPVADAAELRRAVWHRHHAPHNVDRLLGRPDGRKAHLLATMDDDRDRQRRRAAFDEIHQINADLQVQHPEVVEQADAVLRTARVGITNAAVASRRDWCFALYRPDQLAALCRTIASRAASGHRTSEPYRTCS